MASDLETKAKEAFIDDHFELAVDLYTTAIAFDPNNAELYADRAQANIKLHNYTEAVADANKAIELNPGLTKAYSRKGTACIKLEEYHTAKKALKAGKSLAPGDSRFANMIRECDLHISEESAEDVMINTPEVSTSLIQLTVTIPPVPEGVPKKPKYRHEFYQKPEEVVVTIFAKGIPQDNVFVDFGEQILSIKIEVPDEEEYHFQSRLFGKIIPARCRYDVFSTKVEVRLAKAEAINWTSLEYIRDIVVPQKFHDPSAVLGRPMYPSSNPKRVDWDKLEAEVKKEEKHENLDGDAALNKIFQDIFKEADEDTRRAMQKSFVESNGTVLSTNWKEVGSKKVERSLPEGMEVKRWEY